MKRYLLAGLGAFGLCILVLILWILQIYFTLPDVAVLKHYRPAAATEVLDKDGRVLTQFSDRKFRVWVPLTSLPGVVVQAVVTAEDDTFFGHKGVNLKATWDALVYDVQKGKYARGGSTITQQMIKNVLLSREKTLGRKVREFFLARKAEELLTKRRILEIYLNEVEWGENIFGIEAASRFYFDKHAADLGPGEAALLAGMLPNPRYYNPFKRPDKAEDRRERVLSNMLQAKLLTEDQFNAAVTAPVRLRSGPGRFDLSFVTGEGRRPCSLRVLEQVLLGFYGEHDLYHQGIRIRTALDRKLQQELQAWADRGSQAREDADRRGEIPDTIVVVREGGEIRALVCEDNDESIRFRLESLDPLAEGYDVSAVSPEFIRMEDLMLPDLPVEEEKVQTSAVH